MSTTPDTSAHVRICDVDLRFDRPGGDVLRILDGISLDVQRGEFLSIVGPSGCGKTTLLSLTAGLLVPTAGALEVDGRPVDGIPPEVGYLFQKDTLLPWLTVRDNVGLPLRIQGRPDAERVEGLLQTVGLGGFGSYFPSQLSGGMRKRVQVARLWAQDPGLFLLDEPFASLDAQTRTLVQEEFLRMWEVDRKSVVLVTHDLQEAVMMGDRVVVLTRRPCRVKASVEVPFPRPRVPTEVISDPGFGVLVSELWSMVREEVDLSRAEALQGVGADAPVALGSGWAG